MNLNSWKCNNGGYLVVGPTMGTQVANHQRRAVESIAGRIPIFLQALAGVKVQEPQLDDDDQWEQLMEVFLDTEPVAAMRQNIEELYFKPECDSSPLTVAPRGCKYSLTGCSGDGNYEISVGERWMAGVNLQQKILPAMSPRHPFHM